MAGRPQGQAQHSGRPRTVLSSARNQGGQGGQSVSAATQPADPGEAAAEAGLTVIQGFLDDLKSGLADGAKSRLCDNAESGTEERVDELIEQGVVSASASQDTASDSEVEAVVFASATDGTDLGGYVWAVNEQDGWCGQRIALPSG